MSAITIRMPDEKYQRLKALAQRRGTSINRLVDEMTTLMLAESDLETRFELRAARGQGRQAEGLALLHKAAGHAVHEPAPAGWAPEAPDTPGRG